MLPLLQEQEIREQGVQIPGEHQHRGGQGRPGGGHVKCQDPQRRVNPQLCGFELDLNLTGQTLES